MSFIQGTVTSATGEAHKDFINIVRDFATKSFEAGSVIVGTNTGTGLLIAQSATQNSIAETITVTCTSGGVNAVFFVSGSVTGALPDATVNTPYSESVCSFIITTNDIDFTTGDSFSFAITSTTPRWTSLYSTYGDTILQGAGYSGADEILCQMRSVDDDWKLEVAGGTGFDANVLIGESAQGVPVLEDGFTYTIFMSPQRIMGIINSSGRYSTFYTGFLNSLATPSQWSYPLLVGGTGYARYTESDENKLSGFWYNMTNAYTRPSVSIFEGEYWLPRVSLSLYETMTMWPLRNTLYMQSILSPDNSVALFPATLIMQNGGSRSEFVNYRVAGELEGVSHLGTINQTITVNDIINTITRSHIIITNTNNFNLIAAFEFTEDGK